MSEHHSAHNRVSGTGDSPDSGEATTDVEARLRIIFCSLAVLTFVATPMELLLLEHTEDWVQLVPFVASFFGMVACGWVLVDPTPARLTGARWICGSIVLIAIVGSVQHFLHNLELELEIRPSASVWDGVWPALYGAAPFLATGILILGALMVLGATYRHPVYQR